MTESETAATAAPKETVVASTKVARAPVKKTTPAKKAVPAKKAPAKKAVPAKKAPAKKAVPAKKAPAKKAVPAKKAKAERKVKVISEVVSPIVATLAGLINSPDTSNEDLKSLRLELRKFVRASRGVLRTRKATPVTVEVATEAKA